MQSIAEYRSFVNSLAKNDEDRVFFNSDEDRATVVLIELIRKTEKELRVFAGNLCNNIGDNPEYIIALSEFIEKGGKIKILLNNYDNSCAKLSNLFKRLAYYVNEKKDISIKTTDLKPYRASDEERKPIHFTVGDFKSYRIETDTERRTAECNLNSPDVAHKIADFFDNLFDSEESKEINIVELFSDGDK